MPLPRDISHLTSEEQAKVLKERERRRIAALKARGTVKSTRRKPAVPVAHLSEAEKAEHAEQLRLDRKAADPEGFEAKIKFHSVRQYARLKELTEAKKSGVRELNLWERMILGAAKLQRLRYKPSDISKERARRYRRAKTAEDVQFKLSINLRGRITGALRSSLAGSRKAGSAVSDLGCSVGELISYLEKRFEPEMSWDNYGGRGRQGGGVWWELDHVVPLVAFDLTDREQFLKAAHFTNLQPLWHIENKRKGDLMVVEGVQMRGRDIRKKAA